MSAMDSILRKNLFTAGQAIEHLCNDVKFDKLFSQACQIIINSYKSGGRLYIAGNGGSASDASHFAAELVVRIGVNRPSIPAESLTADTAIITAIGNDFGYENIFSRQLEGKIKKEDVFIALSTSGNSPNILKALEYTKKRSIPSILFSSKDGGKAKELADLSFFMSSDITSTTQELHKILIHSFCEEIESKLFLMKQSSNG